MRRIIPALLIATLATACQPQDTAKINEEVDDHSQHAHGNLEVSSFGEGSPIPTINIWIEADPMSGWNLHLKTDNFRFTPKNVNLDAVANEGHAHIFVDGYKMARVYGNWYHLKALTPGKHEVSVSLNANDHSEWSVDGKVISAKQIIVQPET